MTASATPVLEVSDLVTGYERTPALNGVSLTVGHDEVVAVVGSNGVGKTTTLRSIVGQLRTWAGTVVFQGKDLTHVRNYRRVRLGIALVPEGREIFGQLSTTENVLLGAYSRKNRRAVSEDLERMFGLFPRLRDRSHSLGSSLSGGEQQMAAIARALMSNPSLLLLDEPSLGLAPKVVDAVFNMIPQIRTQGISILLVEQNARRALGISDRAYVMNRGRIALEGPASELLGKEEVRSAYMGVPSGGTSLAEDG